MWSVAFKGSMQRLFKSEVEAMATASRHAFTVHIAPMLELLKRREFYIPSSCSHSIDQLREVSKKEFIGAESFEFGLNVIAQARQYVEEMVRVRVRDGDDKHKSIKTYAFWVSKKSLWPELVATALYWMAFPTSSVSV